MPRQRMAHPRRAINAKLPFNSSQKHVQLPGTAPDVRRAYEVQLHAHKANIICIDKRQGPPTDASLPSGNQSL